MYGPVRTVVWQGSAGDRRPYADQTGFPETGIPYSRQGSSARLATAFVGFTDKVLQQQQLGLYDLIVNQDGVV